MCLSTSLFAKLGAPRHAPALAALMVLLMSLGSPPAQASECDDADPGACLDAGTFTWCEEGELKSAKCPEGQICVSDNPFYDGAGCVSTDDTACGDISAEGECTTANGVVWCDEGIPMVYPCGEESICGWDEDNGEYDCLPRASEPEASSAAGTSETPPPDPDNALPPEGEAEPEGGSEEKEPRFATSDDHDERDMEEDDLEHTMMPVVTPTEEAADSHTHATLEGETSSGCQGGHGTPPLWLALAALLIVSRPRLSGSYRRANA